MRPLGIGTSGARWSPDGSRIVFHDTRDTRRACGEIWVANADGSGQGRLVDPGQRTPDDGMPAWSPTGARIAFARSDDSNQRSSIWVADADGTDARPVSTTSGYALLPDW